MNIKISIPENGTNFNVGQFKLYLKNKTEHVKFSEYAKEHCFKGINENEIIKNLKADKELEYKAKLGFKFKKLV